MTARDRTARLTLAAGTILLAAGAGAADETVTPEAVMQTYADIAQAKYDDSLEAARRLQDKVDALVSAPSPEALIAARDAWRAARVPYMQTEVYRFANPIVDEWEGKVNAWPLDEGLIDYVDTGYGGPTDENALAALNVIATQRFTLGDREIDASEITPDFLRDVLNEADGVETNVATGYHAIEFLLWGQDLNGTGPGAGDRPWTDYARGAACTHGHCDRRGEYLAAATALLVSDLDWMAAQWAEGGAIRADLADRGPAALAAIPTGIGSLSYGELAGERMRLGLLLNDPEEEHDCFSDNTHNSHYYDGLGMQGAYLGEYTRIDGGRIEGPSLSDLVRQADPALDGEMRARLAQTLTALGRIKTAAEAGLAYDQMLARGNDEGEALIMAGVDSLTAQTASVERLFPALGLEGVEAEGSDSLDNPTAIFQ